MIKYTRGESFSSHLARIHACIMARLWIKDTGISSMAEAWDKCHNPQWMIWALMEDFPGEAKFATKAAMICLAKLYSPSTEEQELLEMLDWEVAWRKAIEEYRCSRAFRSYMRIILNYGTNSVLESLSNLSILLGNLTEQCNILREVYGNPYTRELSGVPEEVGETGQVHIR